MFVFYLMAVLLCGVFLLWAKYYLEVQALQKINSEKDQVIRRNILEIRDEYVKLLKEKESVKEMMGL